MSFKEFFYHVNYNETQVYQAQFWLETSILVASCIDEGDAAGLQKPTTAGGWKPPPCKEN